MQNKKKQTRTQNKLVALSVSLCPRPYLQRTYRICVFHQWIKTASAKKKKKVRERETQRERERDRDRDRQRERESERARERQTDTDTENIFL